MLEYFFAIAPNIHSAFGFSSMILIVLAIMFGICLTDHGTRSKYTAAGFVFTFLLGFMFMFAWAITPDADQVKILRHEHICPLCTQEAVESQDSNSE